MKPIEPIELLLRQLKEYVEKNSFILVKQEASKQFMPSRGMSIRVDAERAKRLSVKPYVERRGANG